MDDISFKASIDDSQVTTSAARMEATVKKASSSIQAEFNRIYVSQQKIASGGGGGSANYRIGQVALQAQDVAVQLQGGAKYAQVIAQQGSQIASIFGPTGAIIGGVLAITAGIIGWAAAEEKATEKAKKFAEQMEQVKETSDSLSKIMFQAFDARENTMARAHGGSMAEEELKRQKELIHGLEEIDQLVVDALHNKNEISNEDAMSAREQVRYKYAAQEVLATEERIAHFLGVSSENVSAIIKKTDQHLQLEKQIAEHADRHIAAQKRIEEEDDRRVKSAKELMKHARELTALAQKGLHGLFDDYGLASQSRELAKQLLTSQAIHGQKILDKASAIQDPAAAKKEAQDKKREQRAIKEAAEREADEADRRNRQHGGNGLSRAQRDAMIRKGIADANKVKDNKNKVSIDDADINKLAASIAAETAKQIAK